MAYKQVNVNGDAHDFEKNSTVEGTYKQKRENIGENKSNMYMLETLEGNTVGVWGSAVLDNQMAMVNIGDRIKITFLGKEKSEKTKREYKNFMVEVWEGSF